MTITLSKETEQSLENYLVYQGLNKEALSSIVEEAIETFLFRQRFQHVHQNNQHLSLDDVENMVEEAVRGHRQKQILS